MNRERAARPAGRRLPLLAAGWLGIAFTAGAMQPHPAYPPVSTAGALPFEQLERHAVQYVPYIQKLEVRDLLLKVDGYDQQGMKVKVHLDRRTGDLLSREVRLDKHGPFGKHGYARGWMPAPAHPQGAQPQGGVAPRTFFPAEAAQDPAARP